MTNPQSSVWLITISCVIMLNFQANAQNCSNPNDVVTGVVPINVEWDNSNCSFSLTATSNNTNNVCANNQINGSCNLRPACFAINACYRWILSFKSVGGTTFNDVSILCSISSSNSHTFTGLTESGTYRIVVQYKRVGCSPPLCFTFKDEGSVVISDNICPYINNAHSMSQQALINREEEIVLDCALQNNQHTVVKSAEKIRGLPGSSSGTGSFFHAKIEDCPVLKWEGYNGETYSSSHQTHYTTNSVSEGINNFSALNPTDRPVISTTLYPNPTTGLLTFRHAQTISHVEVFDVMGRGIIRSSPNATSATIDLSGNAPGIHFIRATLEDGRTETHRAVLLSP